LNLSWLMGIRPLWGTPQLKLADDKLQAYFWGYRADGGYLDGLETALAAVDGPGPSTEVDCFLLGDANLILIEAKRSSGFGRCSRYNSSSCPAVHVEPADLSSCRYWVEPAARFESQLSFSPPALSGTPDCHRHYQLARTLMVGRALAAQLERRLHLWLIAPQRRWRGLERDWMDFTGSVKDSDLWRRMRVLSWESLEAHAAHH
jgi:hypothetical protein